MEWGHEFMSPDSVVSLGGEDELKVCYSGDLVHEARERKCGERER